MLKLKTKYNRLKVQLRFFCIVVFISFYACTATQAQNFSFEFWPETDIWYRLSPSWRLSAFIPLTKYHESKYRDLNVYLQADYAFGKTKKTVYRRLMDENREQLMKAWLVRGLIMEGWSLGENAGAYREDMLFIEIARRLPLKGEFLFSHRFRTDLRWLGEDSEFSYRFRYRVMLEKDFNAGKSSIVPYVNIEPFWDSRYSKITKTRVIGGATASWGPRFAYECNITYQYDETYNTPNLFALNAILHVFFETRHSKPKTEN